MNDNDIKKMIKDVKRLNRNTWKLKVKLWYFKNHFALKTVVYCFLCILAIILTVINCYLGAVIAIVIYFISITIQPNILFGWDLDKKWYGKLFLFPASLLIMIFFCNCFIGYSIGSVLLEHNPFAVFIIIVLFMAWFSLLDYAIKLNTFQLEEYISQLINEQEKLKYRKTERYVYISFVYGFKQYIEKFPFRLLLQVFRVVLVMLAVLFITLGLKGSSCYSYFELFDKAVVVSLAVDKIFEMGCNEVQKKIDKLQCNNKYR